MDSLKIRQKIHYNLKQLKNIQRKSQILSLQIEDKSEDGINTIWENQEKCGIEINKAFDDPQILNALVYGKTQTGKTGCMTITTIGNYIFHKKNS